MRKAKFTKTLTVALTDEFYNQLKKLSDEKEISMGELIRDILEEKLTKNLPDVQTSI